MHLINNTDPVHTLQINSERTWINRGNFFFCLCCLSKINLCLSEAMVPRCGGNTRCAWTHAMERERVIVSFHLCDQLRGFFFSETKMMTSSLRVCRSPRVHLFREKGAQRKHVLNTHKINILLLPMKRRILRAAGYWMWPMQEAIRDGMQVEWKKYWAETTRMNFIYEGEAKKTSPL